MRKFSLVLFLCVWAPLSQAASFVNGQAARAVIGQNAFTDGYMPATTVPNVLGGASGLAYANGLLYVADDNLLGAIPQNDRIMIFDTTQIAGLHADLTNVVTPSSRCHLCGYSAVSLLGQTDYTGVTVGRTSLPVSGTGSMNHPVAVATDGHYFAVADTDNNRVLLWNSVPANQSVAPNIVLGQANFTAFQTPQLVNANSLRGPQGLWIQNGKLFVADTGNYRVLVWNSIPTQNNQPADFVLGQPNLNSAIHPPQDTTNPATTASQLSNPASVSSDGTHLFVADLGNNRVLIWNSIPTSNGQPADVVLGQPGMTTSVPNNSTVCSSIRNDASGNGLPCQATLNFPRFVLPVGGKLFVADSGNDRILIFNSIPTTSGVFADGVLGQPDFLNDVVTNTAASIASTTLDNTAAVDTVQAPTSLASDGTNLYVADPFNDRVLVFTPADTPLPDNSIVNWASEIIRQEGSVVITGTATANDTVTVTIAGTNYVYTVKTNDTLDIIAQGLVNLINAGAGDPNVVAIFSGTGTGTFYLSSKSFNLAFDAVSLAATTSNTANEIATASGAYLTAGTAATGAPGMLIEIDATPGTTLSDSSATSPMPQSQATLPTSLAGVEVNVDGIPAPILSVSPTQIIAQLVYAVGDRSSVSVYVRTQHNDGSVTATNATPVYIAPANPGLFNAQAYAGQVRPWPALGALHQLGNPSATISIDGSITAGNTVTITVASATYSYTVVAADTLLTVTQNLVNKINAAPDPNVTASLGAAFTRVVLTANQPNAAGNNIPVAGSVNTGATITATAYVPATCCNVPQGQPISAVSPAQPNETIVLLGAGLGGIINNSGTVLSIPGGASYTGTQNTATQSVSATMNGVTAQVVGAGLPLYSYGIYYVQMIVPSAQATNSATPVYIAQNAYISNTVTIPVSAAAQVITPVAPSGPTSNLPPAIQGSAHIVVSPANLVFAIQNYANLNTGAQVVTIQNPAPGGTLAINSLSITGTNASAFQLSQNCPAALQPLASCTATISYSPQGTGLASAQLVINSGTAASPQIVPIVGTTTQGFVIVNQLTGKAIDIAGGNPADFVPATEAEISNQQSQKWALIQNGNNQYYIYNTSTGKVLDVQGASTDPFAIVWQYDPSGTTNQLWSLTPVDNGSFIITNIKSGLVLDLAGGAYDQGTTVWQYPYVGASNQKWRLSTFQTFQIQNVLTGSDVDVQGPTTALGGIIHEWPAFGYPQQQWLFVPIDATYFKIVNAYSQRVLDVDGYSVSDFAIIHQWDFFGGANQLWTLLPQANGAYAIINKGSGKALDLAGASAAAGTTIWQYTFTGATNQQWTLVPTALP